MYPNAMAGWQVCMTGFPSAQPASHFCLCPIPATGAAPNKVKNGNNGAVSCDTFCKGNWGGFQCPGGCTSALDTATGKVAGCKDARGVGTKQVTCCCSQCPAGEHHGPAWLPWLFCSQHS